MLANEDIIKKVKSWLLLQFLLKIRHFSGFLHSFFVYIHPYMDGNGRIARFLMNTQFISGGYDWTIIPVEKRAVYMAALEKASVQGNITDFTLFLASLISGESK
jgi:Fic family protein